MQIAPSLPTLTMWRLSGAMATPVTAPLCATPVHGKEKGEGAGAAAARCGCY